MGRTVWCRPHPLHSCASQPVLSLSLLFLNIGCSGGKGPLRIISFALLCFASFAFIVVLLCFAMYQLVFFILCTRVFHKSLLLWLFCSFALHCSVLAVVVVLHCIVLAGGNPRYSIDCPLFPPVTDLSSGVQFGLVDSLISVYANVSTLPSSPHTSDNTLLHLQAHISKCNAKWNGDQHSAMHSGSGISEWLCLGRFPRISEY